MKKIVKIGIISIIGLILVSFIIVIRNNDEFRNWEITQNSKNISEINWSKFYWTNRIIDGKKIEKTSMKINGQIAETDCFVNFQFDLGSDLTMIYENSFISMFKSYPKISNRIKKLKSSAEFWNSKKVYQNFEFEFGDFKAKNKKLYVENNYGDRISEKVPNKIDQINIGTIGADFFQNKILIIDYPNQRFSICDLIPKEYKTELINIELDKYGRVILPMKLNNKNYRILFDNGSSMFELIATEKNISKFATSKNIDSIKVSSWGKEHYLISKMITNEIELGGKKFSKVKIYENRSGLGIDKETDGTAGNKLFWNNIIIIDFKNKLFGIK